MKKPTLIERLTNNGEWTYKHIGFFTYEITTKSNKQYILCLTQIKDFMGFYQHCTLLSSKHLIDITKENPNFPDLKPFEMIFTEGENLNRALQLIKSLETNG